MDNYQLPIGGLFKDTEPINQPENTLIFGLNGVNDSSEGSLSLVVNEPGNELCYSLSSGYRAIGAININNDDIIIFSTDGTNSEIGITSECNYTALVNSTCLSFSEYFPIKGEFKIQAGCDRMIYWIDGNNNDRSLNIDKLSNYYSDAYNTWVDGGMVGVQPEQWDCDSFSLNPDYQIPCIDLVDIHNTGGSLPIGKYFISARYLDSSLNPTDYFYTTNSIDIVDESNSSSYSNIDGAYNIDAGFSADIGGKPNTNKSIEFSLTNVDQSFAYVRFAAIGFINGNGRTQEAYEIGDVAITSDSLNFVFTDFNGVQIDPNEVIINTIKYKSSKAITQVNNRLLRANLSGEDRMYHLLQQTANTIDTAWVSLSGTTDSNDNANIVSAKSKEFTFRYQGFVRDEIYAFGFVPIFNDGTEGPVFHIPGRVADTDTRIDIAIGNTNGHARTPVTTDWDTQLLNVVASPINPNDVGLNEVKHLGFSLVTDDIGYGAGLVPRWKVFNTAIRLQVNPVINGNQYNSYGIMGYHECNVAYPNDTDCDSNRIYPTGNIRHHRIPDSMIDPHYTTRANPTTAPHTFNVRSIGVYFSNISIPLELQDQIQGIRFVRSVRNESDKTVLDGGIIEETINYDDSGITRHFHSMPFNNDAGAVTAVTNRDPDYYCFHGAKHKFFTDTYNATHFKADLVISGDMIYTNSTGPVTSPDFGLYRSYCTLEYNAQADFCNRQILSYGNVDANTITELNSDSFVGLGAQDNLFIEMPDPIVFPYVQGDPNDLVTPGSVYYVYGILKRERDVYFNLSTITYVDMHSCNLDISNTSYVSFGGDSFSSRIDFRKTTYANTFGDITVPHRNEISHLTFFTESTINTGFRHEGLGTQITITDNTTIFNSERYYPKSYIDDIDVYLRLDPYYENYFAYNQDFSSTNPKLRFPLSSSYNYCSSCVEEYPNRIAYSNTSFSEDVSDGYRLFLANNYTNIPAHGGNITNIILKDNRLMLVQTEKSLFLLPTNPQQLQSDQNTIYLGTGDFLSIPATELIKTDYGYAGNQGRFNVTITEHGIFFVDQDAGKVYRYTDKLELISSKQSGMYHWFRNNLPSIFNKQFKELTGVNYSLNDNVVSDNGIGIISIYDPKFERLILHKRDFKINDTEIFENTYDLSNPEDVIVGFPVEVATSLYDNKSFTISYDIMSRKWSYFHSYMPHIMYNDSTTFYSSNGNNEMWKHGNNNFQNYYGNKYDFILEFIGSNSPKTFTFNNLQYASYVQLWDSSTNSWKDIDSVTFDKILAYNSNQSTGELDIILSNNPYDIVNWNSNEAYAHKHEHNISIGRFRDLISDRSLPIINNEDTQSFFLVDGRSGYMDKISNQSNIDYTLSPYNQQNLRDKYTVIRLWFNPNEDYKIIIPIVNEITKESIR